MRTFITNQIAKQMLIGSSIYSTGGGIAYPVQKKLFASLMKKKKHIPLISIDELNDSDYICTAYAVGSAGNTDTDLSASLKLGMETLEHYTGKAFKAIFAGETNIDIITFQAASNVHLPVLDGDSNGGRAVPEIQFDNFVIAGKDMTPVVAVTPDKNVAILAQATNAQAVELFVRNLAIQYPHGLIAVLDHPIQVKDAKNILTLGIFSRSISLGHYIERVKHTSHTAEDITRHIRGHLLIRGRVTKVDLRNEKGFLIGYYYVQDDKKNILKMFVKNENITCWINDTLIATPPDCFLTVDSDSLLGEHNSGIVEGQNVFVIAKEATDIWRSKKGRELFHPKHFGFNIESKLL